MGRCFKLAAGGDLVVSYYQIIERHHEYGHYCLLVEYRTGGRTEINSWALTSGHWLETHGDELSPTEFLGGIAGFLRQVLPFDIELPPREAGL